MTVSLKEAKEIAKSLITEVNVFGEMEEGDVVSHTSHKNVGGHGKYCLIKTKQGRYHLGVQGEDGKASSLARNGTNSYASLANARRAYPMHDFKPVTEATLGESLEGMSPRGAAAGKARERGLGSEWGNPENNERIDNSKPAGAHSTTRSFSEQEQRMKHAHITGNKHSSTTIDGNGKMKDHPSLMEAHKHAQKTARETGKPVELRHCGEKDGDVFHAIHHPDGRTELR